MFGGEALGIKIEMSDHVPRGKAIYEERTNTPGLYENDPPRECARKRIKNFANASKKQ